MYLYEIPVLDDFIPFTEEVIMGLYDNDPEDTVSPHLRAAMDALGID